MGNFNIASIQGKQNIETIKKSTEQDANKLEKADHAKMQKEVEQDVATIQSLRRMLVVLRMKLIEQCLSQNIGCLLIKWMKKENL